MPKVTTPKTQLSQTVFAQMITDNPALVVNGVIQRAGRQAFFTAMTAAVEAQGETISDACLSNYYSRNKRSHEAGDSFYKHNLTPKQRRERNEEKIRIAGVPEGAVAEADADHRWRARNADAGVEYYFTSRSKADKYRKANEGFKVGQVKL